MYMYIDRLSQIPWPPSKVVAVDFRASRSHHPIFRKESILDPPYSEKGVVVGGHSTTRWRRYDALFKKKKKAWNSCV